MGLVDAIVGELFGAGVAGSGGVVVGSALFLGGSVTATVGFSAAATATVFGIAARALSTTTSAGGIRLGLLEHACHGRGRALAVGLLVECIGG